MSRFLFIMLSANDLTPRRKPGAIIKRIGWMIVALLLSAGLCHTQQGTKEEGVWAREQAYWRSVQANNLEDYRALWSEDFLGWPFTSPDPARKAHITDWITAHTAKGEHLKNYSLERLTVQLSGDLATTTYRVSSTWVNKDGAEQSGKMRILHTWRRDGDGIWRIFSGMSTPVNGQGK
ncbi:MAG TPA: nuclear transport factor 2 family protein [Terracidiphilus sp.]|nr:nuclear transport factor 2 family protein [Terracidiphilus sp.]